MNPKLSFTAGLQTYQWGPAELINPSNPFYHFQSQQGTFGFKSKGKNIRFYKMINECDIENNSSLFHLMTLIAVRIEKKGQKI